MTTSYGELDTLIQEKLDADNDFQATLTDLSDEDKETATETRKSELFTEELASLKEKAEKASKNEELANNYKIRAEKSEQELKKNKSKGEVPPKNPETVSTKDLMALMESKVQEEDIGDVEDYAKFKGISIAEALKTSTVKNILTEKQEKRDTANATNTGNARRSPAKVSDDAILEKARKGEEVDIDNVVDARWNQKKANIKK